jgi:hypothetical protein
METDHLIGQVFERPGSEAGEDHWKIVTIRKDPHGPLATLRNSDGETTTVSVGHLREPYWRPVSTSEMPDTDMD